MTPSVLVDGEKKITASLRGGSTTKNPGDTRGGRRRPSISRGAAYTRYTRVEDQCIPGITSDQLEIEVKKE